MENFYNNLDQIIVFSENFFTKCFDNWSFGKVTALKVLISIKSYQNCPFQVSNIDFFGANFLKLNKLLGTFIRPSRVKVRIFTLSRVLNPQGPWFWKLLHKNAIKSKNWNLGVLFGKIWGHFHLLTFWACEAPVSAFK